MRMHLRLHGLFMAKLSVAFRADSSKEIGMGHITRDIVLASALASDLNADIVFITHTNDSSRAALDTAGIPMLNLEPSPSLPQEKKRVLELVEQIKPDIFILDVLDGYKDQEFQQMLKKKVMFLGIIFDNADYAELPHADFVVNGNPLQLFHTYANKNKYLLGPSYFIMSSDYISLHKKNYTVKKTTKKLLISLGGSDHNNLIFKVLRAIKSRLDIFSTTVALGSAFGDKSKFFDFLKSENINVKLFAGTSGLAHPFFDSDIAITAAGNTLFERLAVGTPGITISQIVPHNKSRMQEETASSFASQGATLHVGIGTEVSEKDILKNFDRLTEDYELRVSMSTKGKMLVDGLGVERITQFISLMVNK